MVQTARMLAFGRLRDLQRVDFNRVFNRICGYPLAMVRDGALRRSEDVNET